MRRSKSQKEGRRWSMCKTPAYIVAIVAIAPMIACESLFRASMTRMGQTGMV
ncbi:hypothetical protein BD311DRAFT_753350 [Dichomitus squalens]|uniref:Uncharacterized protein n=1 Tax=Dichomitus squalens TaxID=114155 RepID=A0A4Q9MTJ3_9APHY|nr:hypothetical protein BD311DRAFT_753350 [Dichomitus squalens]